MDQKPYYQLEPSSSQAPVRKKLTFYEPCVESRTVDRSSQLKGIDSRQYASAQPDTNQANFRDKEEPQQTIDAKERLTRLEACHRLDLDCKRSKKGMLLFHYVIYSYLSLWFPFPFIFLIPPYYYTNTNCMYRYIYVTSPICMSTSMPQCTCHIAVQQRSSRLRCTALTL